MQYNYDEINIYNFESLPHLYSILLNTIQTSYNIKINIFLAEECVKNFKSYFNDYNINTYQISNFAKSLINKKNIEKDNIKLIKITGKKKTVTAQFGNLKYSDGFDLPEDLLSIVSIVTIRFRYPLHPCPAQKKPCHHEFKVLNGKLYVLEDVALLYRYSVKAVKADDVLELPDIFLDLIVKLTGMILNQNPQEDIMAEANKTLAEELIPVRRYANRRVFPIWRV